MINLPEFGYTPANLRALLEQTGTSRERAAELLDVSVRTVQRWCLDAGRENHRDMPLARWNDLLNVLELIMQPILAAKLGDAIDAGSGNLVYPRGHAELAPQLRICYRGAGRWDIAVQLGAPGADYTPPGAEYLVAIGIPSDTVDYSRCDDFWPEEQAELQISAEHVAANKGRWADQILSALGLKKAPFRYAGTET